MIRCNKGYRRSTSDIHKRCVKLLNRSVCGRQGKEFSTETRKCRNACKQNEERIMRKKGTRCRLLCKPNQERGFKFCRKKCSSNQTRVYKRNSPRESRCVRK
jgi:hypothetical protein